MYRLIFGFIFFLCVSSFAFAIDSGMDEVVSGLEKKNVSQVAKYFNKLVEITIDKKSNAYSSTQAEMVLSRFFEKEGLQSFKALYQGGSTNKTSVYIIGQLQTNSSKSYKVYLYFKYDKKSNDYLLYELRFE